jgi:hypothetical protein
MGIFSRRKKLPDPKKRESGARVVIIEPYLFTGHGKKDFFSEVRDTILPYLSEDEVSALKEYFSLEVRSFRALIPESTCDDMCERPRDGYETFKFRFGYRNEVADGCPCGNWASGECCGGMFFGDYLSKKLNGYHGDCDVDAFKEELKDYFIIENIDRLLEKMQKEMDGYTEINFSTKMGDS